MYSSRSAQPIVPRIRSGSVSLVSSDRPRDLHRLTSNTSVSLPNVISRSVPSRSLSAVDINEPDWEDNESASFSSGEDTESSIDFTIRETADNPGRPTESGIQIQPNIELISRFTRIPSFSVWSHLASATVVASFTIYYAWNACFRINPRDTFLFNNPDNTIFTINLLSFMSTLLVKELIYISLDQLRWILCSRRRLTVLEFLALSPATGTIGLVQLLASPVPHPLRHKNTIRHRLWSLERLFHLTSLVDLRLSLYAIQAVLGFVLLLNISVSPVFVETDVRSPARGGVFSFNGSKAMEFSDSFLQAQVLSSFYVTYGVPLYDRPFLRSLGYEPCLHANATCEKIYFIPSAPFVNELQGFPAPNPGFSQKWRWDPAYLKAFEMPIFHITITYTVNVPYEFEYASCRYYGYPGHLFKVCVRDYYFEEGARPSTLYGTSYFMGILIDHLAAWACFAEDDMESSYCEEDSNFLFAKVVQVDVVKLKADVTYNLINRSIEEVTTVSPPYGFDFATASEYLNFYDRIFPEAITPLPDDPYQNVTLENLLFAFCHAKIISSTEPGWTQVIWNEIILMPWIIQQYIEWMHLPDSTAPSENILSVTFVRRAYRISLAPASFSIFSVTSLGTIFWCVYRLYPALFAARPILSSFPDLDLVTKIKDQESFLKLSRSGFGTTSTIVFETMAGVRMDLQRFRRPDPPENFEMEDL